MSDIGSTIWNLLPGWRSACFLALYLLIFTPLELLIPAQRGRKFFRQGWSTDLLHFFFSAIPITIGITAMIGGSALLGSLITPVAVTHWLVSQPIWLQVPIGIVLADLFFYLGHRLQHEVPWLWDFHAVHHSSKELDWLAAFRIHPVDQILERGTSLIPLFVLGFSPSAIVAIIVIFQWQSILIHSNVRIPSGWLKWLVATPDFHHWHHSADAVGHNKNFSGQLPLWDLIFGTAYMPSAMPERYGITDSISNNYLMQLLHPFRRLTARVLRRLKVRQPVSTPGPEHDPQGRSL